MDKELFEKLNTLLRETYALLNEVEVKGQKNIANLGNAMMTLDVAGKTIRDTQESDNSKEE